MVENKIQEEALTIEGPSSIKSYTRFINTELRKRSERANKALKANYMKFVFGKLNLTKYL